MLKAVVLLAAILAQTAGDPPLVDNDRVNVRERPTIGGPPGSIVRQTPTELAVESTSVRQQPLSAIYKLDGSKVTVQTPAGISETGEAKFEGATVVITSRRSFPSPAGDIVADFKEIWSLSGNVLTIVKSRTQEGESTSEKAVFDKM